MKILFDLLPVILFFATYKIAGGHEATAHTWLSSWLGDGIPSAQAPILVATVVTIAVTALQIAWTAWRHGKVPKMMWFSLGLIVVLGGATLLFRNPDFVKWKPTALYWVFAVILAAAPLLTGKNLIRSMLEAQFKLPAPFWSRLNVAWAIFFALMGALNLFVAYRFSEAAWVNFKLFGIMGMMFIFVFAQVFYLSRYMEEEKAQP